MKNLLIGTLLLIIAFVLAYLSGTGDPIAIAIGMKSSHILSVIALFFGVSITLSSCHFFDIKALSNSIVAVIAFFCLYSANSISILWGIGLGAVSILIFLERANKYLSRMEHEPDFK